ncbi:hypothetical protein FHR24_001135 [Wenyingzhuangia heitensis]|uniref:Lipid A deacylase LpxR family protein n=1 Tax=Wenyingzhuangia heitensis TaxID=1487859 RepID=A0ABX0UB55_9FLAO|nr:lipid A-modifier LpxR family protein [Wenyingzhuangia heitensis]NIJ44696.1 hypothetical protein [Wenyingzhuangia heitensis]
MKLPRVLFFLTLSLHVYHLNAQIKKNKEFGFSSDNDLYVSFFLDEYYTNGLELFYKKATPTKYGHFTKKIKEIRLGQKMYNPYNSDIPNVYNQDRPYAGYVYARYSERFINDKNILTIGINTGYTGKKTGAKEAQNFIHQFYDIPESEGWKTQVKQILSIGIHLDYVYNFYYKPEKKTQISLINKTTLNSIFANFSSGLAFKFHSKHYKHTSIANTSFFGTALQTNSENWVKECYWGVKSYVTYQAKDNTITGELWNNPTQKEFHIEPFVWLTDIGYYWNLERWNISYHQVFHTKKTQEISSKWIRYGTINVSYKF